MPEFIPYGPFVVPTVAHGKGRVIDEDSLGEFWEDEVADELDSGRGCYVYAIRAGKGYTPIYVGKATRTFRQECFTDHKLKKLNSALLLWDKGSPVLFLVSLPVAKGKPNIRAIDLLEDFLIQNALTKNPELFNIKGTKEEDLAIKGVLRASPGKPLNAAIELRRAVGL